MLLSLPNLLTYSRIFAIPVVVGFMFIETHLGNWVAFWVYTYACVTDFFDGYLARRWGEVSSLGKFLDPIADKLLVAAVLGLAMAVGTVSGAAVFAAVLILCREILVSGLREFLAEVRVGVPVTVLAKWKTTIQMLALGFLIVGPAGPMFGPLSTTDIGVYGLWGAAALTLVTGYDYLRAGLRHMAERDAQADRADG
jgi:cardiolipin synthase